MTHSNELHQSTTEYSDQAAVEAAKSLNGDYEYSAEEYTPRSAELASDPSLDINLEGAHNFWQKMAQKAQEFSVNGKKVAAGVLLTATAVLATGCGSDVEAKPTPSVSETVEPSESETPNVVEEKGPYNSIKGPENEKTGWEQYFYERNDAIENYPEVKSLYEMPIEEFRDQPKEKQWLLVSWLGQYKEDFDAHYKYLYPFSDYDPTKNTSVDSAPKQLYGEVASWLRLAIATRDPKSPDTLPLVNVNEMEKIFTAVSTDSRDPYTLNSIEDAHTNNGGISLDVGLQASMQNFESVTNERNFLSSTVVDGNKVRVEIEDNNGSTFYATFSFVEYVDYLGNPQTAVTRRYTSN